MCFYFYMIFSVKPVYCAFISVWGGAVLFLLQSHSILQVLALRIQAANWKSEQFWFRLPHHHHPFSTAIYKWTWLFQSVVFSVDFTCRKCTKILMSQVRMSMSTYTCKLVNYIEIYKFYTRVKQSKVEVVCQLGLAMRMRNMRMMRIYGICGWCAYTEYADADWKSHPHIPHTEGKN